MTAIDASVAELASSSLRLSLLAPGSPSAEFALFASETGNSSTETVKSAPSTPTLQQLACYDAPSDWFPSETDREPGRIEASLNDRATEDAANRNWLADLSVEVCKVAPEDAEEEASRHSGEASTSVNATTIDASAADWDESVFFEAAESGCVSQTTASHAQQAGHTSNSGRLDVLLGNPNLHHSSPDLLELDVPSCCDFPLSPKQLLGSANNSRSGSSSSSSVSSHCADDERLPANGPLSGSPPPTPSPGSSVGSAGTSSRPAQALSTQPCSMCSKVFTSTSALAKHKLTHSDERRFACQLCGKAFKRQDHLNGHLITHREKKPFECRADGCGKSYCDARSLRRHQDNHHGSLSSGQVPASPPGTPLLGGLSSNGSNGSPASAALFISELSAGSTDLLLSAASSSGNAAAYPASNSSTGSGSHHIHFTGQIGTEFAAWTSDAVTDQLDTCIQFTPTILAAEATPTEAPSETPVYWTVDQVAESKTPPPKKSPSSTQKQPKIKTNIVAKSSPTKNSKTTTNKFPKVTHVQPNAPKAPRGCHKRPSSDTPAPNNDGLTNEQLELIQQIMRQTQEQHRLMQQEQQQAVQQHKTQKVTASDQTDKPKAKKSHVKAKWSDGSEQSTPGNDGQNASGRPVECNVCQRRFKNTPALNGHMRLHGGFLKKDADCSGSNGSGGAGSGHGSSAGSSSSGNNGKKVSDSKKDPNNPPLLTASVSIRALIEEKIIQRRNNLANAAAAASTANPTPSAASSTSGQAQQPVSEAQVAPKSVQVEAADAPNAASLMMDVLDEVQNHQSTAQSQPIVPKLEPESYFEGSLLALSPVSLHRALEGDMEVHDDEANHASGTSGSTSSSLVHLHHHTSDNFFNASSSSNAGLNDPLLDDSVFHQVSAAAASALLSDISSLDLQSYMESSTGNNQSQQTGQSSGPYSDLSQYLASAVAEADNGGSSVYQHDANGFQSAHHSTESYVYQANDSTAGLVAGFSFDASTPLSSLCSPPHYLQQHHYNHQTDYPNGAVDTAGTFQSMMAPTVASPYTPSPSPVSPAVGSSLPHLQRYNSTQQNQQASFYSPNAFSSHTTANFMLDCANSVLYNMEATNGANWDQSADLTTVSTDAISSLIDHEQHPPEAELESVKPVRIKKPRASVKQKKTDEVDAKKRKLSESSVKTDESRDPLPGPFSSAMRPTRQNVLLDPKRNGSGLFWNLVIAGKATEATPSAGPRPKARIRVGKDYQCPSIPRCKKKEGNKEKGSSVLCWSGDLSEREMDEVERFLAWTRSAALSGSKRSEEHVLSVLSHFHGDVQAAKWHLLTQTASTDPDQWTRDEISAFQSAILQHGKDFTRVAQQVPSKSVAQCVQFYYVWKKVCRPQEYASLKLRRVNTNPLVSQKRNASLMDETGLCDYGELLGLTGDATNRDCPTPSVDASPSLLLLPSCEFADCPPAISTNHGRRRHGNRPLSESSAPTSAALDKLFPCSVCNKVFDKVKSRSAHMKTHKSSALAGQNADGHPMKRAKSVHKSPLGALAPSSPSSTTSSTSCSLPSPFLPSQSLF